MHLFNNWTFDKELLSNKIGDGMTTIAFPIALAILILVFNNFDLCKKSKFRVEDLTNEIKKM